MLRYVLDSSRARFLDLLPIDRHSRVLEIGPGLGQLTRLIAPRVRSVHALEVVSGQAHFVREVCLQENLGNVEVACGGDDCRLPYAQDLFDVVVLNLVLEWCGHRDPRRSHPAAQDALLAEIHRVLCSGGVLYLATKNRYALRYLLGKPDEHAHNLRFGNALPRPLLALLLRFGGHARAQGFLSSFSELEAKLERAGFARLQSFWAVPEMRFPSRFLPTDSQAIKAARRQKFDQGELKSTRALMPWVPARLVKHVMPGLTFLAWKP